MNGRYWEGQVPSSTPGFGRLRAQRRMGHFDPKEPFASPESGHSNSDKLTFAGEVGGTP